MAKYWCRMSDESGEEFSAFDAWDYDIAATDFMDVTNNDSGGEWAQDMLSKNLTVWVDVYKDGEPNKVYRVPVQAEAEVNFYSFGSAELVTA